MAYEQMQHRNSARAGRGAWGRSPHLLMLLTAALAVLPAGAHAATEDTRLVDAARRNEPATVRALLDEGLDVDASQPDGSTALLWAAYYDDAGTVDLLLAAGADANAANEYGEAPLSLAARNRNAAIAAALLAAGADPHHVKPGGETVLMTAARAGSVEVVNLLLARDADVNAREPSMHQTALMFAAAGRHRAVAEALVAAGADVNAASKGGSTALHFAVQQADIPTARLLLDADADVHAAMTVRQMDQFTLGLVETFDGQTPLWLAITNCRKDGLEYFGSTEPHPVGLTCPANEELGILFLERGADPNQADGARFLPLQRAVQTGMENLAAALLRHGADPNSPVAPGVRQWTGQNRGGARRIQPVPIGATPYFIAAWTHNPDLMRLLLDAGADPHAAAADGSTPLHAIAGVPGRPPMGYSSHLEPPRMLAAARIALDEGADINAANHAGRTPMHGAADIKSPELIQFLFDNGARLDATDNEGETPLTLAGVGDLYDDSKANAATKLLRELAGL